MNAKIINFIFMITALCSSCAFNSNDQTKLQQPNYDKAFDLNNFDFDVRPQDDFFTFVNGRWVKKTLIPKDRPNWNTINEIRELTENNSLAILNDLLHKKNINNFEQQNIKSLFKSFIDIESRNKKSISPIQEELRTINNIKSLQDLQIYLTHKIKLGQSNPFINFEIDADFKNSKKNAIYLAPANILLPKDYFQKKSQYNTKVILEYINFTNKMLGILDLDDTSQKAKNIVNFENNIAQTLLSNEQTRDPYLQYNPIKITDLNKKVKNLNLTTILNDAGINSNIVIITSLNYYNNLDKFINDNNINLIKDYLKFYILVENSDFLDENLAKLNFDFYKKFLQGQKQIRPIEKRGLIVVNELIGESFGKLYVQKYFPEKSKQQVLELVDYLIKSFNKHIENVTWMSQTTKNKAIDKLKFLKVKIGYPEKWEDYSKLIIPKHENDLLTIINNIKLWQYNTDLEKIGQNVDKDKWEMNPQTVNAYYNPLNNEIVFPAGILQAPFFNPKIDPAVNFGAIGAIIGHEITHGFDDSGCEFDKYGNLNNWWNKQDKNKFTTVTKQLENRFNKYEILPGYFVNGKFTLGENIADLGGLNIAFDALQTYLQDKGTIEPIDINDFSQNQRFFISWATIWRSKSTDEFLKNQIKTDPHAPEYFRSFAPLVNIDAFYKAFNVKSTDKLYLDPKQRIKIW